LPHTASPLTPGPHSSLSVVPEGRAGISGGALMSAGGDGEEDKKGRRKYASQTSARTPEAKDVNRSKSVVYKKKLEQRKAMLDRTKSRVERIVRIMLFSGGFAIFLVLAAAAISLEMVELCRYPVYELCEDFYYKIDVEYPVATEYPRFEVKDNKVMRIVGGQIEELTLKQVYGTYTLVADHDMKQEEIRFKVCNRATNKFFLNKISTMDATNVEVKGDDGVKRWRTNLRIDSVTSNEMTGPVTCRRADVTIYVPTACLLDETKLMVRVEYGDVVVRDIKNSTVNTISLENNKGDINVLGLMGERVNLNTTRGKVDAVNVTAHHLFLLAQEEGGTIYAQHLTLTDGEDRKSCRNNTFYLPGFPQEPVYLRNEVVCDRVAGELTIDARGSEGDIVEIDRVVGGNINHFNKIGNTNIRLMACYDFVGEFGLATRPVSKYKVDMVKSQKQLREEARSLFGIDPSLYPPYFKFKPQLRNNMVIAEVCGPESGYNTMPSYFKVAAVNQTMYLMTNGTGATGTITVTILPPEMETALGATKAILAAGIKMMPPPPPQFIGR